MEKTELISLIKKKKELSGLSDSFVISVLDDYLKKSRLNILGITPSGTKVIIKEVRARLRKFSGQYQRSLKLRQETEDVSDLLASHSSTNERLDFYPELKKKIASLRPKSILDLGCGLNPIALADKSMTYYASDIKEDELEIIQDYFKKNHISGNTFICDLRNISHPLPKADLCLMFKVIDVVDPYSKRRGQITENILLRIPCPAILASFATKKLSGKKMNFPDRFWFEEILKKLSYSYSKFSSDNEIFYLIKKSADK